MEFTAEERILGMSKKQNCEAFPYFMNTGILKRGLLCFGLLCLGFSLTSCGKKAEDKKEDVVVTGAPTPEVSTEPVIFTEDGQEFTQVEEYMYTTTKLNVRASCSTDAQVLRMLPERAKVLCIGKGENWSKVRVEEGDAYVASEYLTDEKPEQTGHIVVIDAAHQETADEEQEAIGPGAEETKAKVTVGTKGVSTGMQEYELTLAVAKKLQMKLSERGYEVVMIRESNDVNLSTKIRSDMAKEAGAEAFIRIHANSSKVSSTNGVMTICGTKDSPYVAEYYEEDHKLSETVLEHLVDSTGAENKGIWETDLMAGINWSTVPTTIVQLGYMSNEQEDEKMETEDYQNLLAQGIADGIDAFFAQAQ